MIVSFKCIYLHPKLTEIASIASRFSGIQTRFSGNYNF